MPVIKLNLKLQLIMSNLCDYSDAYMHVKGTTTVPNIGTATAPINRNKNAPFINCIIEINSVQVDDAHDIDVVMPTHNLLEYSDTSKTSGNLSQYYRDEAALGNNYKIIDFPNDNNNSILFKQQIQTANKKTSNGQWHKRCLNNGSIKISKQLLEKI